MSEKKAMLVHTLIVVSLFVLLSTTTGTTIVGTDGGILIPSLTVNEVNSFT